MKPKRKVAEDPIFTDEELRLLASVAGSPAHKPLSKAFTLLRNAEHGPLLSPDTPHETTQYVRGRLAMLRDLVLLLEEDAPAAYEARKKKKPNPQEPAP